MTLVVDSFTGPLFSIKNRLLRIVWGAFSFFLIRFTPAPMHAWRAFWLRCFGAKLGRGVHIYPGVKIWAPWNLECADEVGIGNGATIYNQGKITLGYRAIISQGVHLCAGTHDYTLPGHPLITKPINVGANAWVAAEAFVHPGVTIGEGAVIGARSVVTKDMPAWMVCSGFPCKPIKVRELNSG
jgi:putative colanic acid biosynthesis acetyltransferase WcaF